MRKIVSRKFRKALSKLLHKCEEGLLFGAVGFGALAYLFLAVMVLHAAIYPITTTSTTNPLTFPK